MSFGIGLHVMVALAYNEGRRLSSNDLARSLDANPVTIRRVISDLVAAGLVDTHPGPGGGAALAKPAGRITVQQVYDALGSPPFIGSHSKAPQRQCIVSCRMPQIFERLNHAVADKAGSVLKSTTLKHLVDQELRG